MALVMTPIYTQTVGAGGASTINFNNIPQHFTDLYFVCNYKSQYNGWANSYISFNDTSSIYSATISNSQATNSFENYRQSGNSAAVNGIGGSNVTANTFSTTFIYIPNYTSSTFKQIISDFTAENNADGTRLGMAAGLYRSTGAITSASFGVAMGWAQYSTISLYGIIRSGA